ncbi:MAG: hypothetical protein REI94_06285 [Moraxellaceae bacterium]|nr:hypothetical protein [Moraxellaceae bacterium]
MRRTLTTGAAQLASQPATSRVSRTSRNPFPASRSWRSALLVGAVALLAACEKPAPSTPMLTAEGFDKARFGASATEVATALGEALPANAASAACTQVRFKAYPGLLFMVEKGLITRVDADAGVKNTTGIDHGMLQADVIAKHPNIEVWPHKYDEKAHVLVLAEEKGVFVFEEKQGHISAVRAGVRPAVEYVEGCS